MAKNPEQKFKLQDYFDFAKSEYQTYMYSGNTSFVNKAMNYYRLYKKFGGKKVFESLEKRL